MSLIKSQILYIHSSCVQHLLPDRDIYQSLQHRGFHSALLSSLQVGNSNGALRRQRRIITRSVMEGRETKVKRVAHHAKGKGQKKGGEQQNLREQLYDGSNGATMRTDSLGMRNSSLAPADFCNVEEEELDELDEDDELQIYRALVLDLSYRYLSSHFAAIIPLCALSC